MIPALRRGSGGVSAGAAVVSDEMPTSQVVPATTNYTIVSGDLFLSGPVVSQTITAIATLKRNTGTCITFEGQGVITVDTVTNRGTGNTVSERSMVVVVNGGYYTTLTVAGSGTLGNAVNEALTLTLPTSEVYRVQIWEPMNGLGTPRTFTSVTALSGKVRMITRTKRSKIAVLYSDSIGAGVGTSAPLFNGIGATIRRNYAGNVAIDAVPSLRFVDDTPATKAQNLVDILTGPTTRTAVIVLGINDANNSTPLTTFSNTVTSLITELKTRDSGLTILLVSPWLMSSSLEPNVNGVGLIAQDYRDALAALASGVSRVTYFNGASLGTLATTDGVHLTDDGAATAASAILARLP